jgi:hypothetical protein
MAKFGPYIYDPYVGMIWDSIDNICMGLVWCLHFLNIEIWKTYGNKHIAINPMGNLWGYLVHR